MPAHSSTARTGPPAITPVPADAGTQEHDTGSGLALHRVRDGHADARDAEEVLLRLLDALADRQRHLAGLAVADAHQAVAVADDHEGGEAEATTALDDLRDAVDGDDALQELALVGVARLSAVTVGVALARPRAAARGARWSGRPVPRRQAPSVLSAAGVSAAGASTAVSAAVSTTRSPPLGSDSLRRSQVQPPLSRAFGDRGDATGVPVATTIEHDIRDAGLLRALGDQLADLARLGGLVARRTSAGPPRASTPTTSVRLVLSSTTCTKTCRAERVTTRRGRALRAHDLLAKARVTAVARGGLRLL